MATHVEAVIVEALMARAAALTLPTGWAKAYEGVDFNQTAASAGYVRFTVLRNRPVQPRIRFGNDPIRFGIFQASVFGREGGGLIAPTEVAGTVRDHFARGTRIVSGAVTVRIDDEPSVETALQEPAWLQIPVSIPFIVYP